MTLNALGRPKPTMNRPMATTTTAVIQLATVIGDVVADRHARHGEADHGHEVHDPDAGAADGPGGEQQPAGATRLVRRSRRARAVAIRPSNDPSTDSAYDEHRREQPVREVVDVHASVPFAPTSGDNARGRGSCLCRRGLPQVTYGRSGRVAYADAWSCARTPRVTASIAARAFARIGSAAPGGLGDLAEQVDHLPGPADEVAGRHLRVGRRWPAPWTGSRRAPSGRSARRSRGRARG